eukprot:SAG22_NODE_24132_length_121_cov_19.000000_1_plen_30_part_10
MNLHMNFTYELNRIHMNPPGPVNGSRITLI